MEIDLIFKIAAIGIIVSILNQVLSRSGRDEQATMTTLAGLVVVLMMIAQKPMINGIKNYDEENLIGANLSLLEPRVSLGEMILFPKQETEGEFGVD